MSDWRSAMGMLERDAALAPYLRQSAAFIWSLDGKVVLCADASGESLRLRLGEGFGERARERIRLMGQGLAPLSGVRLERLSLSPNPSHPPLTCACRRLRLATGQEGLLILAQTAGVPFAQTPVATVPAKTPQRDAAAAGGRADDQAEPEQAGPAEASAHDIVSVADGLAGPAPADGAPDNARPAVSASAALASGVHPVEPSQAGTLVALPPRMRFVWSSDAEGRVTGLSPEFLALLRLDSPEQMIGRRWVDMIGERLRDSQGRLAAGLASEATFSDALVLFRIGRSNGALNTTLSGSPVFAAGRVFQGFRGFGALKPVPAASLGAEGPAPSPASLQPSSPDSPPSAPAETLATGAAQVAPPGKEAAAAQAPASETQVTASIAPSVPQRPKGLQGLFPEAPFRHRQRKSTPSAPSPAEPLSASFDVAMRPASTISATPNGQDAPPVRPEQPAVLPRPPTVEPDQPPGNDDMPPRLPAVATLQSRLPDMLRQGQQDAPAGIDPAASAPSPLLRPLLTPAKADLTAAEKQAFRQIAEALGAEIAETAPLNTAPPAPPAETPPPESEPVLAEIPDTTVGDAVADEVESAPAPDAGPGQTESASIAASLPEPASVAPRPSFAAAARALAQDGHAELLDKLPVGVLVSRNGEVAYGNRTFLDLLGYDDLADIVRHGGMENLFRGRAPDEGGGAVLLVAKDGDLETVEARLSAIAWQGRPATLMSFRRAIEADAPARARALELDLDASRKRLGELSSILDTATDGVVTLDERGRILSLNSAAEALFGYDQREVTGEIISMLFAPESHAPAMDYLDGLKGGGVASVLNDGREVVGMVRQGGRVPLFMTMGRIADGADAKFCAVLRDITAWKKAESELTEARKAAEQASAQKSDVLAKISHEIRTPLNAIIGFSEVMAEERFGPIGSERYKEYARDIRESGNYLISLVNDLLDLAKIEAGRLDLDFESVNLNDIANSAVSLLQPEAARNRVVLRTGLSTRLPPVVADERSLRQIVINLLSNAVKFTDSGGQVIVSTALGDKGEAILRVRDTGIGMTPDQLKLALEPFRQVSATRRGGGTGLGLPLTKALVEANRGAFQISSVPKEGTLAEVVFPPQRVLAG